MNIRAQIEGLSGVLEAIRSEITELADLETPTEEQVTRSATLLDEWDSKKAEHDDLVARADRLDAIRAAALVPSNREAGFGAGINVSVKADPFENVESLRYANPNDPEIIGRTVTALESLAGRSVPDSLIDAAVRTVENVGGSALYALVHAAPAYRSAFAEFLRTNGQPNYTREQAEAVRASMSLTSATGGYALPTLLDPTIIKTGTGTKNPIRRIARVETGTQNVWHGLTASNVTTYWKAEGSAFTDGSPSTGGPSVTAAALTAYVIGSYEIFEDSGLQAQLGGLISDSFDVAEAAAFISGSGSTAPKGIVTAISATAGSTVTATTRGSFTSASAVDLYAVVNAVPVRFEDTSTWVANKATYNTIRQMDTTGGGLFWAPLGPGTPTQLLGSPNVSAQDMSAATTSGTVLAILGDFSRFLIYDRIGTTIELVPNVVDGSGLPTGQRGILARKRVGSDVLDVNAFRFLKT